MDGCIFKGNYVVPETYHISINRPSNAIYIANFRPEGCVGPDTYAQLTWIPNTGLELVMWSYNETPLARYENPNDPVCKDSCMECFIDVFPRRLYKGYINIEMNALGTCLCAFGPNRKDRKYLTELGLPHPEISIHHVVRDGGRCWMAKTLISKEVIEALYEYRCDLGSGHKMRANFYTCAEDVNEPYWGSWAPVGKLDFHTPEYFGNLEIV